MLFCQANEAFSNDQGQPTLIQPQSTIGKQLSTSLDANIALMKDVFFNDDTVKFRSFGSQNNKNLKCCLVMIDGMVEHVIINEHIMTPIFDCVEIPPEENLLEYVKSKVVSADETESSQDIELISQSLLSGDTVLFVEGYASALIVNTKGWKTRQVVEPDSEKISYGPKEGFVESLLVNLSMLRRKIRSPELKLKFKTIGARTNTRACIAYHEALVNQQILAEVVRRVDQFNLDAALDTEYIKEMIRDAPYSPFDTINATERPDVVTARILEGRIAIFLDGTPEVMTIPHLFMEKFQANQDYYGNYMQSSFLRIIRMLGFFLSVSVPAVYLSLVAFHKEFLPTPFLLSMLTSRQDVPFPTIVELLLMLGAFEVLREAGARMPTNIGQALSIVGALVLGQAAVQAKIASAPIIIVAALTSISALILQRSDASVIALRVAFIAASFLLGIYGYILAVAGLMLHLLNLRSFGVPYLLNASSFNPQDLKDTFVRAPWWLMKLRTKGIAANVKRSGGK